MFFVLSKIFWMLVRPSHWLGFLILATALSLLLRWNRAARFFGVAAALLLVLASFLAVPLARDLEDRYPRPPWPAHVDGILVLGSGFDTALFRARGAPASNEGIWRVEAGFAAARRYPGARLVFSGGSGALGGAPFSEAETARVLLAEMGQDPRQLTLEARSRNTYENILFSKEIVKPKPGEVWLLATAAMHMPRAMAIARKLDWPMTPWPSDYLTAPSGGVNPLSVTGNLGYIDYVVHEWIGLLVYRLSGKAA
ncbi:MAG TPA: YdcF family protein [Rhizomicrobium sp.]|nr:YdcF family protein [Rhizomicrobium sp.]